MKSTRFALVLGVALSLAGGKGLGQLIESFEPLDQAQTLLSPVQPAFNYQGRLLNGGRPFVGVVKLQFRLFDGPTNGEQIGLTLNFDYELTPHDNGLFSVDLDFGGLHLFDGSERWLQISMDDTILEPRQPLMAAPYALFALSGNEGPPGPTGPQGETGDSHWLISGSNTYYNSGFVGIGTPNPRSLLSIGRYLDFYSGGHAGPTRPSIRGSSSNNLILSASENGATFLNFDGGAGGVRFHDGTGFSGEIARLTAEGNLGIGTQNPTRPLVVVGNSAGNAILSSGTLLVSKSTGAPGTGLVVRRFVSQGGNERLEIDGNSMNGYFADFGIEVDSRIQLNSASSGDIMLASGGGNVAIGNITPQARLHVAGGTNAQLHGGGFLVMGSTTGSNLVLDNNEVMARNNGQTANLHLNKNGGAVHVGVFSNGTGRLVTPMLQITGGSDLAERFHIADAADIAPKPGMVVSIDVANPGRLLPSTSAYDRTVAGVISGANGIQSGMVMGQLGSVADGDHAVALTGRVYVLTDASAGAIQPGDLLTSSGIPGHAMKVTDYSKAHGAIIGKAMSGLNEGEQGYVLVLVSLQ